MSWRPYRKQLSTARRLESCGYLVVIRSHFNNLIANLQKSERKLKTVDAAWVGVRRNCKHPRAVSIADYLGWLPKLRSRRSFKFCWPFKHNLWTLPNFKRNSIDYFYSSLTLRDLSGTSIESLPSVGLDKLEELKIQHTESLKQIPSVYNFKVS